MLQLCAALAPRVDKPLDPDISPKPPVGYTCPISYDIMIDPVILVQTGHSYEAANIERWLGSHNTCPATGKVLTNKIITPNHNLRHSIQCWAQQHGVQLRSAPKYEHPMSAGDV